MKRIVLELDRWTTLLALLDLKIKGTEDEEDKEELRNIYDDIKTQIKRY